MRYAYIIEIALIALFVIYIIKKGEIRRPTPRKDIDLCINTMLAKFGAPRTPFILKSEYLNSLQDYCYDEALLTAICHDILTHCGMTTPDVLLRVTDEFNRHAAGFYIHGNGQPVIEIIEKPYEIYQDAIACLIHESMHHFLISNHVGFEDRFLNEMLTDVATVYMGFGEYMTSGSYSQGYLTSKDLKYVARCIEK